MTYKNIYNVIYIECVKGIDNVLFLSVLSYVFIKEGRIYI